MSTGSQEQPDLGTIANEALAAQQNQGAESIGRIRYAAGVVTRYALATGIGVGVLGGAAAANTIVTDMGRDSYEAHQIIDFIDEEGGVIDEQDEAELVYTWQAEHGGLTQRDGRWEFQDVDDMRDADAIAGGPANRVRDWARAGGILGLCGYGFYRRRWSASSRNPDNWDRFDISVNERDSSRSTESASGEDDAPERPVPSSYVTVERLSWRQVRAAQRTSATAGTLQEDMTDRDTFDQEVVAFSKGEHDAANLLAPKSPLVARTRGYGRRVREQ